MLLGIDLIFYGVGWIGFGMLQLQPSEFAVIGLIIAIAAYCDRRTETGLAWKDVFKLLIIAGICAGVGSIVWYATDHSWPLAAIVWTASR